MLTLEEIKELPNGDWVWEEKRLHSYVRIKEINEDTAEFYVALFNLEFMYIHTFSINSYGKEWAIYKNREQAQ